MTGLREQDSVILRVDLNGLPAGTRGTVLGLDSESATAMVAFVDGASRPVGIERVRVELLRLALEAPID